MGEHIGESILDIGDSNGGVGSVSPDNAETSSMSGFGLDNEASSSNVIRAAQDRSGGFLFGADRAIGSAPNWDARNSDQLYQGATVDNDPTTADALGQTWIEHGKGLNQIASDLYGAITELGSAWIGKGAGAAQDALLGIANSSSQAAEAAQTMGNKLADQAVAAAELKKMPTPKEFDPAQSTSAMLAGGPAAMMADMKAQSDAAKGVKAQQIQFYNAYTAAMSDVDGATPSFGPESLGMPGAVGSNSVKMNGAGGQDPQTGLGGADAGATPGTQQEIVSVSNEDAQPDPAGSAEEVADGSSHTTGAGAAAPASAAGTGSGIAGASEASQSSAPSAPVGAGMGQSLGAAALGGGLGLAAGKASSLKAGSRTGSAAKGAETAASVNNNQDGPANSIVGNAQQNQGGVVSPNGTIGGQNNPQAAPVGGMGGMRGAHAGAGQKDEEHTHASFLIEPDPNDAFGANQATPPPVIGVWSDAEED